VSIDYDVLARELLRHLRGRRSQLAFSRRLGFRTNVAYTWESGRRWPTAAIFLHAASRSRIDVRVALSSFFAAPPRWLDHVEPTSRDAVASFLEELRAKVPIVDVARRAGRSRFAVARWLSGEAEPRLPDFFRMVDACSLRLLDFVALFADPETLSSTSVAWQRMRAQRRAVYDEPWLAAVLLALELESYRKLRRHRPGWLARRLGITRAEEDRCLRVLEAGGLVRWERDRWAIEPVETIDTRPDAEAERRLKAWWSRVGAERVAHGARGLFSFNVFTVSERDLARLEELHRSYFRNLRALVASSSPGERVVAANVQLFPLDG